MPTDDANRTLLEEVNSAGLWFRATKTKPIWVKRLETTQRVTTLEGEEEVPAGAYLCRGEAGDIWPQSAERLLSKYVAAGETSADGWQKYLPDPDSPGVWAAKIKHPFDVQASWGRLHGKAGDYLVKDVDDDRESDPSDVWIVDAQLFSATYEAA